MPELYTLLHLPTILLSNAHLTIHIWEVMLIKPERFTVVTAIATFIHYQQPLLHYGFVDTFTSINLRDLTCIGRSGRHKKLFCYCHMFIELCSHFVSGSLSWAGIYHLPFTAWQELNIHLVTMVLHTDMQPFPVVEDCMAWAHDLDRKLEVR